jgi:hypothetical protein
VTIQLVPARLAPGSADRFEAFTNVNAGYVMQRSSHYEVTLRTGSLNPQGKYAFTLRLQRYGTADGVEFGHVDLDRRLNHNAPLGEPQFDDAAAAGQYTIAGPYADFAGERTVAFDITYYRTARPAHSTVIASLQVDDYPPITRSWPIDPDMWPAQ